MLNLYIMGAWACILVLYVCTATVCTHSYSLHAHTFPDLGENRGFCIFIASRVTSAVPCCTISSTAQSTALTTPGIGARSVFNWSSCKQDKQFMSNILGSKLRLYIHVPNSATRLAHYKALTSKSEWAAFHYVCSYSPIWIAHSLLALAEAHIRTYVCTYVAHFSFSN